MTQSKDDLHAMRMVALNEDMFGMKHLYMHLSALSPTTRKSHAERHGKLYTAQQVRDFWSDQANIEGCKCSVVAVMVDENNQPVVPAIVDRARATYKKMAARGYDWSK